MSSETDYTPESLGDMAQVVADTLADMKEELIAAYIFENNLEISPRLVEQKLEQDDVQYTFYWVYHDQSAPKIPAEFEPRIAEYAERYEMSIAEPRPASETAIVYRHGPMTDDDGKLKIKFEVAWVRKALALAALKIPSNGGL